jgi:hypothetical protein
MECVILYRPSERARIAFVWSEDGMGIANFTNRDAAIAYADKNKMFATVPYQIVECDEL